MTALTDEELMARVKAGDADSFGVLAARYQGPLFALAHRYLGRAEEAEEVRQEALLRAFTQARRFDVEGRFRAWVYRIALNLCHDRERRRRRLRWFSLSSSAEGDREIDLPAAEDAETMLDRLQQQQSIRRMRSAMEALPAEQRTVLVLKEYEELTFREIAETLGCPESTVKSRLYRGLMALRAALADDGGTERT